MSAKSSNKVLDISGVRAQVQGSDTIISLVDAVAIWRNCGTTTASTTLNEYKRDNPARQSKYAAFAIPYRFTSSGGPMPVAFRHTQLSLVEEFLSEMKPPLKPQYSSFTDAVLFIFGHVLALRCPSTSSLSATATGVSTSGNTTVVNVHHTSTHHHAAATLMVNNSNTSSPVSSVQMTNEQIETVEETRARRTWSQLEVSLPDGTATRFESKEMESHSTKRVRRQITTTSLVVYDGPHYISRAARRDDRLRERVCNSDEAQRDPHLFYSHLPSDLENWIEVDEGDTLSMPPERQQQTDRNGAIIQSGVPDWFNVRQLTPNQHRELCQLTLDIGEAFYRAPSIALDLLPGVSSGAARYQLLQAPFAGLVNEPDVTSDSIGDEEESVESNDEEEMEDEVLSAPAVVEHNEDIVPRQRARANSI
jgi:hypothetical protein